MPPTYADPVHGVSYSEALKEAMAVAPIDRAILETLEFLHPDLAAPIRLVANTEDITACLEEDAPADGGEYVEFTAVRIGLQRPAEDENAARPTAQFWVDGVSSQVAQHLTPLVHSLEPVQVNIRCYAADDLSGPASVPAMQLELVSITVEETRVTCSAAFGDQANRRFPGKSFLPGEYPGLAAL